MLDEYTLSLTDLCMEVNCEAIGNLLRSALEDELGDSTRNFYFTFRNRVFLPEKLCEKFITMLSAKGLLNPHTMSLFDYESTHLRFLKIPDASALTRASLRTLKQHKLKEIQINKLKVSVNDLVGSLGEWSLNNLEVLNVSQSVLLDTAAKRYSVIVSLVKLKNLRELDVSYTKFNEHNLNIIVEDLPRLESLNISETQVNDINSLLKCKHRLKRLIMANLQLQSARSCSKLEAADNILLKLSELRHLDISMERNNGPFDIIIPTESKRHFNVIDYPNKLPHLISLDISGHEDIDETSLIAFLRDHPDLKFLGLMCCEICSNNMFLDADNVDFRADFKVTGTGSLQQVILGMKLYEKRPTFIQRCLYSLYTFTEQDEIEPRTDIIKLVTKQMRKHGKVYCIQLASTACLYNITKWGWTERTMPPLLMSEVTELTLNAMENFPLHFQLQKNALLILYNDRILQYTKMDRFRCAKLVRNTFCKFSSETIERLCVAISSVVAAKISSQETTEIGSNTPYMAKLLDLVKRKMNDLVADSTLGFALSTLWNLTDESPRTCSVFLDEGGLELFTKMLEEYDDCETILTKILGLFNNIAEVAELRNSLMNEEIINCIRSLLHSDSIEVSYFSAGVFAHLLSVGADAWTVKSTARETILQELETVVVNWKPADDEMVAYRSFRPFLPLLNCFETYQAQLWALWAIQHVLTANASRYFEMLKSENIYDVFVKISREENAHPLVCVQVRRLLEQLDFRALLNTTRMLKINSMTDVSVFFKRQK